MDMSVILIVGMVLQVFAYTETHQIVCIKYVQFFFVSIYLNIAVKRKESKKKKDI